MNCCCCFCCFMHNNIFSPQSSYIIIKMKEWRGRRWKYWSKWCQKGKKMTWVWRTHTHDGKMSYTVDAKRMYSKARLQFFGLFWESTLDFFPAELRSWQLQSVHYTQMRIRVHWSIFLGKHPQSSLSYDKFVRPQMPVWSREERLHNPMKKKNKQVSKFFTNWTNCNPWRDDKK